jgi:SAM-dependent methyltransferase
VPAVEKTQLGSSASRARLRGRRLLSSRRIRAGLARRAERYALLRRLPRHAVCAEVGTWRGDHAAQILRWTRPRQLYLIDPWEHRPEGDYEGAMYGGQSGGQQNMDATYNSVLARFARRIDAGQVVVRRQRSADAALAFAQDELDWVYIDGDHRYDGVKADLESFARAVKPGGLIAGDDYGLAGWWEDGVTRAVDEFAASDRCAKLAVRGSQFLIQLA